MWMDGHILIWLIVDMVDMVDSHMAVSAVSSNSPEAVKKPVTIHLCWKKGCG